MQLMWVSGPTGKVHTISITARKVLISTSVLALALVIQNRHRSPSGARP